MEGGKTTRLTDEDLSHWEQLVQDLQWSDAITLENIKAIKINENLSIAYCVNAKKILNLRHLFWQF